MTYSTFLPNYFSGIIESQQQTTLFDDMYFYVADGVNKNATANNNLKTIKDEQLVINEIIYGGKIKPNNIVAMIPKITWETGKVYSKYDSKNPNLSAEPFYVINSQKAIYKCLDNNNGSVSSIEPISVEPGPFMMVDGYIWQYLYKLTDTDLQNYVLENYIPIIKDPIVTEAAVRGTVSSIDITSKGEYELYNDGEILVVNSLSEFRISDNAPPQSAAFENMGFYVKNGLAAGQIAQITDYMVNSSGRWVTIDRNIVGLSPGDSYSITPYVKITGNGQNATARSIINNKQIEKIEVINSGSEYTICSAELISNEIYTVTKGSLSPNLSPIRGHGADVYNELYADTFLTDINMDNYTIMENLPINDITFCKVGILRRLHMESDENTAFNEDTFNNTYTLRVIPQLGKFAVGDEITLTNSDFPKSKVIYANTTHIIGVYETQFQRYAVGNNIKNMTGVQGMVLDIIQPEVKLYDVDINVLINTDTISRSENSNEKIQLLIGTRTG